MAKTVKWRKEVIKMLGGVCSGLSFIGGPDCPIPQKFLTLDDINVGHRVGRKYRVEEPLERAGGGGTFYKQILSMKNPHKHYIALCYLCNQRMRHIKEEFGFLNLPKTIIDLYTKRGWTLEQLGDEFNCAYETVPKFLKRNGVVVRQGNVAGGRAAWSKPESRKTLLKERRTRWLTKDHIELAKEMAVLRDEGDTLREIAEWFGVNKGSVIAHLRFINEA